MMPDQRSVTEQLLDLVKIANSAGMYDAADMVNSLLQEPMDRTYQIRVVEQRLALVVTIQARNPREAYRKFRVGEGKPSSGLTTALGLEHAKTTDHLYDASGNFISSADR